ncbi:hypothetical protein CHLRE_06g259050v5 [Chlamydomonas reinhardtii]|uniref:Glycosyltransferase family 92 protein n=1 Tax=Chlamydomonas reinhardtii TaxID=3055 RepID=A0A2K3DML2_CHLRE|nr:uncharacterized protein CHLRE_06g259050v5 [Chlamydomonas reinhardtii]PNW81761.1 hypothetical protein CHLRE_06g259050v5 [Chlamydomonas reinhardtii]
MQAWARRVGGQDVAFGLPHQQQAALRVMLWVDYTGDLHLRLFGHLRLPVDPAAWQPRLVLEGPDPLPTLEARLESGPELLSRVQAQWLRPYSLRFELPPEYANVTCFKLLEKSYPGHKAPFCVPLEGGADGGRRGVDNSDDLRPMSVCEELAPRDRHTDSSPALWAAIGPPRHAHSTRDWGGHMEQVAIRTVHYLAYHVAMGMSGLLLYTDAVQRHYLRRVPALQPYLTAGHLRLVEWDYSERNHADDGRGRSLGYNYDQALFASHALLGLSACGTNVALMISDLDEYLYGTKPDARWPEPYARCVPRTAGDGGRPVVIHTLQRMEMLSSAVPPDDEPALWTAMPNTADPQAPPRHPLAQYDRRKPTPMTHNMHNKPIVLPAGEVVLFFVHEGAATRGEQQVVAADCVLLMHVPNYWRPRSNKEGQYRRFNVSTFLPFQHWLFDEAQNGGSGVTFLT